MSIDERVKQDNQTDQEYKWYEINFDTGKKMTLQPNQEYFLDLIRQAGREKKYAVKVEVSEQEEYFLHNMLYNRGLSRLKAVLREAFGSKEGEEFKEHNISQLREFGPEGKYWMIVFNEKYKPTDPNAHWISSV
ncbi:hypothetical protein BVX95_02285 [archaeon D22]|nr:hypothetical protein BVX95_02285 [archaeon D22]